MASEYVPVGRVRDVNGWVTEVQRDPGGLITIFSGQETKWDAARLADLRELLDRAAMPGQPAAEAAAPQPATRAYRCCKHCEHDIDPPPHAEPCGDDGCAEGHDLAAPPA